MCAIADRDSAAIAASKNHLNADKTAQLQKRAQGKPASKNAANIPEEVGARFYRRHGLRR